MARRFHIYHVLNLVAIVLSALSVAVLLLAWSRHDGLQASIAVNLAAISYIFWSEARKQRRTIYMPPVTVLRELWDRHGAKRHSAGDPRPTAPGLYLVRDETTPPVLVLYRPDDESLRTFDGRVVLRCDGIDLWYGPLDSGPLLLPFMANRVADEFAERPGPIPKWPGDDKSGR